MRAFERVSLRQELDERLLPFRMVKRRKLRAGWVRSVRLATGMREKELAERMGVGRREVRRLEVAETSSRIMLGTLQRAAAGLGCDLVYALVPKEGTLADLAAVQDEIRERALAEKRAEREEGKQLLADFIGMRESALQAIRACLRREGYRVRPAETDRNVAKQIADFEMNVRVLKVSGLLGPYMKDVARIMREQFADEGIDLGDWGAGARGLLGVGGREGVYRDRSAGIPQRGA